MMTERRLTQKQHTFCLKVFEHGDASRAAIEAGYSPKYAATHTTRWLKMANVKGFLEELRQKAEDASIMNVTERKQRLTEIGRGRITDFVEVGEGGARVKVALEEANSGAIQEVTTDELKLGKGKDAPRAEVTKIKLHNPMQAIDILNKMGGDYAPERSINLNINAEASNLSDAELERIAAGKPAGSRKRITEKAGSAK